METLLIIVVSLVIGWKASQYWHLMSFHAILKDLKISEDQLRKVAEEQGIEIEEEESDPHSDLPELEVCIEQHPEGLFAYRKADSFFIAQGKDREELMANLVNNLNNVRVVVAKEDGAELITP